MMTNGEGRGMNSSDNAARRLEIASGAALIGASVMMGLVMVTHPTVSAHGLSEAIEEIEREARVNAFVHGFAIFAVGVLIFGTLGVCDRLGWNRALTRAGFVAYVSGALGACIAGLMNGFVVPRVLMGFAEAEGAELELARVAAASASQIHHAASPLSVYGLGLGVALFSIAMIMERGAGMYVRVVGALGIIGCGAPMVLRLAGQLTLDVQGYGLFVLGLGVWSVGAGVWLVGRRG